MQFVLYQSNLMLAGYNFSLTLYRSVHISVLEIFVGTWLFIWFVSVAQQTTGTLTLQDFISDLFHKLKTFVGEAND